MRMCSIALPTESHVCLHENEHANDVAFTRCSRRSCNGRRSLHAVLIAIVMARFRGAVHESGVVSPARVTYQTSARREEVQRRRLVL